MIFYLVSTNAHKGLKSTTYYYLRIIMFLHIFLPVNGFQTKAYYFLEGVIKKNIFCGYYLHVTYTGVNGVFVGDYLLM